MPSASYTFDPAPWSTQTVPGLAIIHDDVAPPAKQCLARSVSIARPGLTGKEPTFLLPDQLGERLRDARGLSEHCHRPIPSD